MSFPSEPLWSVKQHQSMRISKHWEEHFINVVGWQSMRSASSHLWFVFGEKTASFVSKVSISALLELLKKKYFIENTTF